MATSPLIPCGGLQTDRSPVAAPAGAMRRADHVVIDAPGVASARPNFDVLATKSGNYRPVAMTVYQGTPFYVSRDGSSTTYRLEKSNAVLTGTVTPRDDARSSTQFAEARGNLYFTTEEGVKKISDDSDTVVASAGVHPMPQAIITDFPSTAPTWLADDDFVAYRVVLVRTDANNVEVRSAPSPWTYGRNETDATSSVEVTVALPGYAAAGDVLELYRSKAVSSGVPSDELFLVRRHSLVSGDISAGYVEFTDTAAPNTLGAALYTNQTREGIEGANGPPPSCVALASWKDSMWFGATRRGHELVLDLSNGDFRFEETTGTTTLGTNTITSVADPSVVSVGAKVVAEGFTADARVTHVDTGTDTVTINETCTSGSVGGTVQFIDLVVIDGVEYFAGEETNVAARRFKVTNLAEPTTDAAATLRELAYVISRHSSTLYAQAIEGVGGPTGVSASRLILRRTDPSSVAAITANVSPCFAVWDAPYGLTSRLEYRPNRVYYSKPLEPEHVPELSWIEIGQEQGYILRLVPMPAALLVLKEDGLYRISGTYPFFNVDVVVPQLRLVRAEALDVMEDVVYAWTDRGVLEITENGVAANLSEGLIRDQLAPYLDLHTATTSIPGTFIVCWRDRGLVLLGVGDASNRPWARNIFVWNIATRTWSRWPFANERGWRCAVYDVGARRLLFAIANTWESRRSFLGEPRGYDRAHTISTYELGGTVVEVLDTDIDNAGTWVPQVGDWVALEGEFRRVISVFGLAQGFERVGWIIGLDSQFSATEGTMVGYEGAPAVLEWMAQSGGGPSVGALVREMHLHIDASRWNDTLDVYARIRAGASTDLVGPDATMLEATPEFTSVLSRPLRFALSRSVARSAHLYPRCEINERLRWRLMGVCLVGEGVSERVRK